MSFDALTLACVRDEITPLLLGARIQRVSFPDAWSLAFESYAPGQGRANVLLCVDPERDRVSLLPHLAARGVEHEAPFHLLARKYLRDARIRALSQPPFERVLHLELEWRDDDGSHRSILLIVEVMGRRGNVLLVGDDGAILDALRRAPPSRNPRRPILPHLRYTPPPAQDRVLPTRVSSAALAEQARGRGGPLHRFLVETVAGLSPLAAREIAYRANGSASAELSEADWHKVMEALGEIIAPAVGRGAWAPCLATREDVPLAYAPYELRHLAAEGAHLEQLASMSAAIEAFHAGAGAATVLRGDPLAAERKGLLAALRTAESTAARRAHALEQQLEQTHDLEALRSAGETILAYQWQIEPGQTTLDVNGAPVALDPEQSPVENAQRYFARYRKAREAAAQVPGLLEGARNTTAHLAELAALVTVATSPADIRALRHEVAEATRHGTPTAPAKPVRRGGQPAKRQGPYRRVDLAAGWDALVGGSAGGNATVTFDLARPDDVWLHARGVPGAHVVLRGTGLASPDVLRRAAEIAAWHSAERTSGTVAVDYVQRRHVRKIPGGPPGLVRYEQERTLHVTPRAEGRPGTGLGRA